MRRLTRDIIERRIEALRLQAEKLEQREKIPALHEIVNLMQKHDLSVSEIRKALAGGKGKRKSAATRKGRKVKPMYRNAKTGETWSGRGRPARWLAAAEKAGHKRTEFLIEKA